MQPFLQQERTYHYTQEQKYERISQCLNALLIGLCIIASSALIAQFPTSCLWIQIVSTVANIIVPLLPFDAYAQQHRICKNWFHFSCEDALIESSKQTAIRTRATSSSHDAVLLGDIQRLNNYFPPPFTHTLILPQFRL